MVIKEQLSPRASEEEDEEQDILNIPEEFDPITEIEEELEEVALIIPDATFVLALTEEQYQEALFSAIEADDLERVYALQAFRAPLLTAEDEVLLAKRVEAGVDATEKLKKTRLPKATRENYLMLQQLGEAAAEQLVMSNTRLVLAVIKRRKYAGLGMDMLDMIEEGDIGLLRTVEKFDYRKGFRFSTYAHWWIRQSVSRALQEKIHPIRLPINVGERLRAQKKAKGELVQELGREPSDEELATRLDVTVKSVRQIKKLPVVSANLEDPTSSADPESVVADTLLDEEQDTENAVASTLLIESVAEAVSLLPEKEALILRLRFGLEGNEVHTLEQVGKVIGVTRERVRQLEAQALRRMRASSAGQGLRDYDR